MSRSSYGSVRRLPSGRYQARVTIDGDLGPLGTFRTRREATAAMMPEHLIFEGNCRAEVSHDNATLLGPVPGTRAPGGEMLRPLAPIREQGRERSRRPDTRGCPDNE